MSQPARNLKLDVFGRTIIVRRRVDAWEVCYVGNEGKIRPAEDIRIPEALSASEIPNYIADICHEWATPQYDEVRVIE